MEVWRRIDTEREGEEEEGRVKQKIRRSLRFQFGTLSGAKGKECLRSQIVTSEETELEVANCNFKIKRGKQTKRANHERNKSGNRIIRNRGQECIASGGGEERNGVVECITDGSPF